MHWNILSSGTEITVNGVNVCVGKGKEIELCEGRKGDAREGKEIQLCEGRKRDRVMRGKEKR